MKPWSSDATRIDLICSGAHALSEACRVVEAQGFKVGRTAVREAGQPLAAQLRDVDGGTLIVEASCQSQDDLAAIEKATTEHPGLVVLLLSASRDSAGLIAAMRAGVREVLASPPAPADLGAALTRLARRRVKGPHEATLVTFMACKGGSGATFLAANFAHQLARATGRNTAFIDLDLEFGDGSFFVTTDPVQQSVVDIARQIERLDPQLLASSMLTVTPNFKVLPSPADPEAALVITAEQVERLLDVARATFDFVVIDLQRALDAVSVMVLDKADFIYPVLENMIPYIRNAKRLVRSFRALGYGDGKVRLVVNRFERNGAVSVAQIERAVGFKVHHTVPNSWKDVAEAVNLGVPLSQVSSRNPVVQALDRMVQEVAGANPAGARTPQRILQPAHAHE